MFIPLSVWEECLLCGRRRSYNEAACSLANPSAPYSTLLSCQMQQQSNCYWSSCCLRHWIHLYQQGTCSRHTVDQAHLFLCTSLTCYSGWDSGVMEGWCTNVKFAYTCHVSPCYSTNCNVASVLTKKKMYNFCICCTASVRSNVSKCPKIILEMFI